MDNMSATQGRTEFIYDLIENVDNMAGVIADREIVEPDLGIVRELAEQLREELHALRD